MKKGTTKHSIQRARSRGGIQKGIAIITIRNAWHRGISHGELDQDTELRKWIDGHVIENPHQIRLYGEHLYIFTSEGKCITVLNIPDDYLSDFTALWQQYKTKYTHKNKIVRQPSKTVIRKPRSKPNPISKITGTRIEKLRIPMATYKSLRSAKFFTLGDFLGRKNTFDSDVIEALAVYGIAPDEKGVLRLSKKLYEK